MNRVLRLPFLAKASLGLLLSAAFIFALSFQFGNNAGKPPLHQPKNADEFEENAEARSEWFMRERTFPTGEIPTDARRRAWDSRPVDARFADSPNAAPPQWRSIGPQSTESDIPNWGLTSGRINAIAVSPSNPQLILIGAATGGIWRSTDGGTNFFPTTDNQVDLSVGSISFAPSDNSIVYAGLGDKASNYFGSGVLKSTDGGQTWTRVSNSTLPSPGRISQILVDSADPNRVYVAQYANRQGNNNFASGFYYSTDGGVSWTKTISGLARDLVKHPSLPMTLYLGMARVDGVVPTTGGVFRSDNGGQSWTRVYTSPYATTSNIKIAVTPAAPQSLYVLSGSSASAAQLEVSTNEGGMWTNRASNFDTGQLSYNFYLFVHPTEPNTIFVGTRDMWRSTNGGVNFTNITNNFSINGSYNPFNSKAHPDQHHFYISQSNPNLIYLANDGGFYRSTDGANSFQSLNATLNLTMFTSLDLHPTDPTRTYGGTQDNGNQRKRGNNMRWTEFVSGDGGQIVVDPVDPSIVYTTYVRHVIDRYRNNTDLYDGAIGNSNTFGGDSVAFYPPFVGNDVNSNLYFGTYRLYMSTNRGLNWAPPAGAQDLTFGFAGGDVLSAIAVAKSDTNVIYTGSAQGRAMISTTGGTSFTQITNGLPPRFIKSIVVSPTNPSVAYLTVSGFDSGHVFKTVNAGGNWTDISGNLPNIPTNTLVIDPRDANTLYVGTDIGVFRSTTDGNTWETFNNGMPPVIVTELDVNSSGLLQAGTYGRGAYQIDLVPAPKAVADFDGDGKTDVSVFRPSDGTWYLLRSTAGFTAAQFGANGDIPASGDYDGDGKTDLAVYRPQGGFWYIMNSSTNTFRGQQFGISTDKPVANDFDGDGKTDIAVYRDGAWYSIYSSNSSLLATNFGIASDVPVPADFDGDGRAELAVYRDGVWYTLNLANNQFNGVQFGIASDKPVTGDYDADGKDDYAVYRVNEGTWYVLRSTGGFFGQQFGIATDIPTPGDYDGDGKSDLAVYRPADGAWYIINSANSSLRVANFGLNGDIPIPSRQNP